MCSKCMRFLYEEDGWKAAQFRTNFRGIPKDLHIRFEGS